MIERLRCRFDVVVLAVVAYLPALISSPGRMPADTKLYLYLNPGRQLSDSLNSWDTRQFAGWVPHQTVGYLWPSGPWFWTFDRLAIPDWVAHRLWIGTILVAAGLGVRWVGRMFGLRTSAALGAALVYQCSPYVLPYIGRTSVLLLPWAGLGWLFGHTVLATRRGGWRNPAAFALIIATVGGINATALAMIAPLPLVWIADAAARRELSWRAASATVLRIGGAALLASLWWLVPLTVQGRFGAQALAYSETLEAVSSTANATEALRGFGYWLFYVVDRGVPLTSAGRLHQTNIVVIVASWVLILAGIRGLAFTRWRVRRVALVSLVIAVVLAVGVHPIENPSPLTSSIAANSRSTWALALRSSTRALPVAMLMLALGCGAVLQTLLATRLQRSRRQVGAMAVCALLVLANNPALVLGRFVDPALDRSADPPSAYVSAASALDQAGGSRVLQLPGAESGVFEWGTTVDPVLPSLTERPVVQRDWLPLGSAAAMDLLYALDDRLQDGTAEPSSIAPVARLLGASSVAVLSDMTDTRFGTADPATVVATLASPLSGLETPTVVAGNGQPTVSLFEVSGGAPIMRAKSAASTVIVVGSGAGLVDAASAALIDGSEALLYAAALPASVAEGVPVIVTDSNRSQAHHWRGSQAVLGMTEGPGTSPTAIDIADHRMPVYPSAEAADQTVAEQRGGLIATASVYGPATEYHPESRPYAGVDGDPATAWTVGSGHNPVGQTFTVTLPATRATSTAVAVPVRFVQPAGGRRITAVDVGPRGVARRIELSGDDVLEAPLDRDGNFRLSISIAAVDPPVGPGTVGFSEVTVQGVGPTEEVVITSPFATSLIGEAPVAYVLSRWRVGEAKQLAGRDDPETRLLRAIRTTEARFNLVATIRPGDAPFDPSGFGCRNDVLSIDGRPVPMKLAPDDKRDPQIDGLIAVPCDSSPLALTAGEHIIRGTAPADVTVDRVVLTTSDWDRPTTSPVTVTGQRQGRSDRHATVGPCPDGCWFVLGEGYTDGWRASVDGRSLGAPELLDGGMAGWWLDPSDASRRVTVIWPPQRLMWLGLAASLVAVVVALVIVVRRRTITAGVEFNAPSIALAIGNLRPRLADQPRSRRAIGYALLTAMIAALAIDVVHGCLVAVICIGAVFVRRAGLREAVGVAMLALVALRSAWIVVLRSPGHGFGWPSGFENLHRLTLVALFVLLSAALDDGDREPGR